MDSNERVIIEFERKAFDEQRRIDSMPRILFKYKAVNNVTDLTRLFEIFKENKIFMPTYELLNDPLEGVSSRLLIGADENAREKERKKWQILSLSQNGLIPSLWAYYAGEYSGVSIGFKTHNTFDEANKIEYVSKQSSWSVDPALSVYNDLFVKNYSWESEQEWRVVREGCFDDNGNILNPHFNFSEDDIVCVFLGCKMKEIIQQIITDNKPKAAKIFIVEPDIGKYRIYAKDIDTHAQVYTMEELYSLLKL